ncbi:MAG: (2Fe-2S)-binding protein [Chelatococcus sp.]|nr:MAG: (2Fe-2S)-binding protein [Chelatococcus sp.]
MRAPETHLLRVNGVEHRVEGRPDTPLIYALRNDLALNSPKFGCGLGECGACTVLLDGAAARSCALPLGQAAGREIVTLEGLAGPEGLHPIQQAFVDKQAAQCGYCISGMIMTAKAFLDARPQPSAAEIREALRFNLCRCGTHLEIVEAIALAAARGWAVKGAER